MESHMAIDAPISNAAIPRIANNLERRPRSDHPLAGGLDPETWVGHIPRTLKPNFSGNSVMANHRSRGQLCVKHPTKILVFPV